MGESSSKRKREIASRERGQQQESEARERGREAVRAEELDEIGRDDAREADSSERETSTREGVQRRESSIDEKRKLLASFQRSQRATLRGRDREQRSS